MKITINWVTRDWNLIRRLREKYRLPQYMNVNGLTEAEVDESHVSIPQIGAMYGGDRARKKNLELF